MPRLERLNCPALLALASGVGETVAESGALRGRYGGSGMGNVVCGIGTEGSRSCFEGAATYGLPVKRAMPSDLDLSVKPHGGLILVQRQGEGREELGMETHRSPAVVPNACPRYRSGARLS
jgi:hypothetical protein